MYRNSPAWLLDCITTPTKSTAKFEQAQSAGQLLATAAVSSKGCWQNSTLILEQFVSSHGILLFCNRIR